MDLDILLIHNNNNEAELIHSTLIENSKLAASNIEITPASDLSTALDELEYGVFDVVLVSENHPEADEITYQLHEEYHHIPVLQIAHCDAEDITAEALARIDDEFGRFNLATILYRIANKNPQSNLLASLSSPENSECGILILDENSQVCFANPAASRLLGYQEASLLGQAPSFNYDADKSIAVQISRTDGEVIEAETTALPMIWQAHNALLLMLHETKSKEPYTSSTHQNEIRALHDISKANEKPMEVIAQKSDSKPLTSKESEQLKTQMEQLKQQLLLRTEQVSHLKETLLQLEIKDSLTAVANRRVLEETLEKECLRAARVGYMLSLLLVDVDHFDSINKKYGQETADKCLITVAKTIASSISRPGDLVARYDTNTFAVILPWTDLTGGKSIIDRIRHQLSQQALPQDPVTGGPLTVTIGYSATIPEQNTNASRLAAAADLALETARKSGHNQSVIAMPE